VRSAPRITSGQRSGGIINRTSAKISRKLDTADLETAANSCTTERTTNSAGSWNLRTRRLLEASTTPTRTTKYRAMTSTSPLNVCSADSPSRTPSSQGVNITSARSAPWGISRRRSAVTCVGRTPMACSTLPKRLLRAWSKGRTVMRDDVGCLLWVCQIWGDYLCTAGKNASFNCSILRKMKDHIDVLEV
ncbi:UNVERIFIED_CONTAM: hypothetical protein GTU68_047824, partial [Idotea baltica]|nr:hypothetical protein [Idotea baltica]